MVGFLAPALLGAALGGGGGGSSSSSTSASTNTIGFTPTINLFGDIRGQNVDQDSRASTTSAAVSDNTPSSPLGAGLFQPENSGVYGELDGNAYAPTPTPMWIYLAGGAAVLVGGYLVLK